MGHKHTSGYRSRQHVRIDGPYNKELQLQGIWMRPPNNTFAGFSRLSPHDVIAFKGLRIVSVSVHTTQPHEFNLRTSQAP